ncbi:MAG: hypothetical protein ACPG77_18555, partial [Nannocystaceae bacterium]
RERCELFSLFSSPVGLRMKILQLSGRIEEEDKGKEEEKKEVRAQQVSEGRRPGFGSGHP